MNNWEPQQLAENGILLVHAFGMHKIHTILGFAQMGINNLDRAPYIDMAQAPEKINLRDCLSCSVIKPGEHTETWGSTGIIITAPSEAIVATDYSDRGTYQSAEEIRKQHGYIMDPETLLQGSSSYNEVVIDPKTAKLAGFFVKVKSNGEPLDPYFAEITYGHARRLGLPVEKVKSVSRFGPQMGIFDNRDQKGYFSINHDGKNFKLYSPDAEGNAQPNFMVYDLEDWTGHFMTPDEFRFCHKLLLDDGYGQNYLSALEQDFIVAGERRKLPRPLLTEGKITRLSYDVTINGREYLMSVSCDGSASLTCMKEMQEAMLAISASRTTMSF